MKYYILLLLVLLLTLQEIKLVNSSDANLLVNNANHEFSYPSNWDIGRVPTKGDRAYINSNIVKKDITVSGYLNDINVDVFFLGSTLEDTGTTFITVLKEYHTLLTYICKNTTFLSGLTFINSTSVVNDGGLAIVTNSSFINQELYSFSNSITAFEYCDAFTNNIELNNGTLFLNLTYFTMDNSDPSRPFSMNNGALFQLLDSDFGTSSDFLMKNVSKLYLQSSNFLIQNYESNNDTENLFILYNSLFSLIDSTFFTEKTSILAGSSIMDSKNSNFTSTNYLLFDDDSLVVLDKSYFTFYQVVFLDKNSTILTKSKSTILLYNSIRLLKHSVMAFQESTIIVSKSDEWIYDEDTSLYLMDNTQFSVNTSVIYLEYASLVATGDCRLVFNYSNVFIKNHVLMNETSEIFFYETHVFISGSVGLTNDTRFSGQSSNITIQGSLVFTDYSFFYFNYSTITIEGSFVDNTLIKDPGGIIFTNLTINGNYVNHGMFLLISSNLICNNEFLNQGGSLFSKTSITINNGNFNNYGAVHIENSNIVINKGSMLFFMKSYMICINSSITIVDGAIIMEPFTLFNLSNTIIYNQHGSLNARGNIYIDLGSGLVNGGSLLLNSNILLKDNSTSTGNEKVINQGKFEIKNNITQEDESNESNVYLPLFNSGSIDISKITNFKSLVQENGGSLNLLASNSTLTIQDDFSIALNGSITITVDNLNNSFISVKNNFINNNSSLIIRVDINRIQEKNNTIIEWSNNSGVGFSNIQFKSYDPSTGEEKDINDSCHQVYKSSNSFNVLISNGCKNSSSLTKAQVAGIVVGIVGFVAIIGCIVYFKKTIYYKFIYNIKEKVNIKLPAMNK